MIRASNAARSRARRSPASDAEAWTISSCSAGAASGKANAHPSRAARAARAGLMSTTRHLRRRNACQQGRRQQADDTRADDQNAFPGQRRGVPAHVQRGFHVRGQHRAVRRDRVGHGHAHRFGREEAILMRIQNENPLASSCSPTIAVTVFDRKRERSGHQRRPHRVELSGRNTAGEDQRLGAARDTRSARALIGTKPGGGSGRSSSRNFALARTVVQKPRASHQPGAGLAPGSGVAGRRVARAPRCPPRATSTRRADRHAVRTNGMSSSTSAPIRCAVQAKRRPSSSRSHRRQWKRRHAAAHDQRRHRHMQPIERARPRESATP